MDTEAPRKSAQEIEIDHLLAEEFSCDLDFASRFTKACVLSCTDFVISSAIAEPSLAGDGFGDLLVQGESKGMKVALLIEDKITAGPATRQSERYAAHANRMLAEGWHRVWCVLVAPASYGGERDKFDAFLSLEILETLLSSPDPVRLAYRRGIINRALRKKNTLGVKLPDKAMHRLKSDYLRFAGEWNEEQGLNFVFPSLRQSYDSGDSWINPIRHSDLPHDVWLRHRFWTSNKNRHGRVDLIFSSVRDANNRCFYENAPSGTIIDSYSNGKGIQLSMNVPEIRQSMDFDEEATQAALDTLRTLLQYYISQI